MAPRPDRLAAHSVNPPQKLSAELMTRALALFNAGQLAGAETAARKILKKQKTHRDARHLLAMISFRQNDLKAAADALELLVREHPDHAPLRNDYGMVLTQLGQYRQAEAMLVRALELAPEVAGFHLNLGNLYKEMRMFADAERHYRAAIYHNRNFANAYQLLSAVLIELGRSEEATRMASRAVELTPRNPGSLIRLGKALSEAGLFDQARQIISKVMVLAPDQPQYKVMLAEVLTQQSDFAAAEEILREVIVSDPHLADAHGALARIIKYVPDEPHIMQMEEFLAVEDLRDEDAITLHFALLKAYEDIGAYEKSFAHSLAGNRLVHKSVHYPRAANEKRNQDRIAPFTPALLQKYVSAGSPDDTPIFIVGMPRSGTTLTEQILSSHSDVFGAGELSFFGQMVNELKAKKKVSTLAGLVSQLSDSDFRALGDDYVVRLRNFSSEARFIVDKMPGNFANLGFIRLALPKAKVIYCRRNAPDNCLSIFNLRFAAEGLNFAYDLDDLAHTYRLHEELMAHWASIMPDFICENRYEDMIADSEAQTRKLLAFCGLEWQDACAQFFRTERTVHTSSMAQVRRPIYRTSLNRWERYGDAVQPLLDALEHAVED